MASGDLISIIVPVYNVEKYLAKCLDSIREQSYKNFEVILIDDGSTDSSVEICKEYCSTDDRFKLITKKNGGASTARNVGLKNATGKYIYFLDSDDWLKNNALETLINKSKSDNADLVFCEALAIDDTTGKESYSNYSYHKQYETGVPYKMMKEMLKHKEFHVAVWILLIERDLIEKNEIFFKEGIIYEDMIFAYQIFTLAERAAHVHEVLYNRRYRENSVMTTKKGEKNFVSAVEAYKSVVAFNDTLSDDIKSNEYIVRCAYNALNDFKVLDNPNKKKYLKDYRELKQNIKEHGYFEDNALRMRCKGYALWVLYKVFENTLKRVRKGKQ